MPLPSQTTPIPLVERVARALCVHYSGDPEAEFCGQPMWRQFEVDARAMLPIVIELANELAGKPNGSRPERPR